MILTGPTPGAPIDPARITIVSVARAATRRVRISGVAVPTGYYKQPVDGPVAVGPLGLDGDEQADPSVHGGLGKAVYLYPGEHYPFWERARRAVDAAGEGPVPPFGPRDVDGPASEPPAGPLPRGALGENLTITGLLEADAWIGDELVFPDCTLRISAPRNPCFKFNAAMGFRHASKLMAVAGLCGFYCSVAVPGTLAAGQTARLVPGGREVTVAQQFATRKRINMG